MSKLTTIARFAGSAALSLLSASAFGETTSASAAAKQTAKAAPATDAPRTGRAAINGVDYYYEIRGKGEPLLLLHGGLGSSDMFGPVLTKLAEGRKVITVDLQGHGRTPLGNRAFKLESIGDDMAVLAERHALQDLRMASRLATTVLSVR